MTLACRVIPCLDVKDGRVVKGVRFVGLRDAGDPVEAAAAYDAQGADELTFLDITASHEARAILLDVVRRTAEAVFMPLTVGGGVRALDDIRTLLEAGADKVSINTAAVARPELVGEAARRFGSQCITVAIDAKRVDGGREGRALAGPSAGDRGPSAAGRRGADEPPAPPGRWEVFTHGGRRPTGLDVVEWARRMAGDGAGELLVTSMDRDGTREGYDLALTRAVSRAVPVPVVASGGAGRLEHLAQALLDGEASAVLAASIFHFGETTVGDAKAYLAARGIPVRSSP